MRYECVDCGQAWNRGEEDGQAPCICQSCNLERIRKAEERAKKARERRSRPRCEHKDMRPYDGSIVVEGDDEVLSYCRACGQIFVAEEEGLTALLPDVRDRGWLYGSWPSRDVDDPEARERAAARGVGMARQVAVFRAHVQEAVEELTGQLAGIAKAVDALIAHEDVPLRLVVQHTEVDDDGTEYVFHDVDWDRDVAQVGTPLEGVEAE